MLSGESPLLTQFSRAAVSLVAGCLLLWLGLVGGEVCAGGTYAVEVVEFAARVGHGFACLAAVMNASMVTVGGDRLGGLIFSTESVAWVSCCRELCHAWLNHWG